MVVWGYWAWSILRWEKTRVWDAARDGVVCRTVSASVTVTALGDGAPGGRHGLWDAALGWGGAHVWIGFCEIGFSGGCGVFMLGT
jgi:hypothetical protein